MTPTPGIMENFSLNTPARTRGRPRKESAAWWTAVDRMEGRHTSHRHRANSIYGAQAYTVLKDEPRCAWLREEGRGTIMNELGRIAYAPDIVAMALYLCEHRPSTRQAVAMIREFRLATRPPGTSADLQAVLWQALETYLATHAAMSSAQVQQALEAVAQHWAVRDRPRTAPLPQAHTPLERILAVLQSHRAPGADAPHQERSEGCPEA